MAVKSTLWISDQKRIEQEVPDVVAWWMGLAGLEPWLCHSGEGTVGKLLQGISASLPCLWNRYNNSSYFTGMTHDSWNAWGLGHRKHYMRLQLLTHVGRIIILLTLYVFVTAIYVYICMHKAIMWNVFLTVSFVFLILIIQFTPLHGRWIGPHLLFRATCFWPVFCISSIPHRGEACGGWTSRVEVHAAGEWVILGWSPGGLRQGPVRFQSLALPLRGEGRLHSSRLSLEPSPPPLGPKLDRCSLAPQGLMSQAATRLLHIRFVCWHVYAFLLWAFGGCHLSFFLLVIKSNLISSLVN